MKKSECHGCQHLTYAETKSRTCRCKIEDKGIETIKQCPLTETITEWTPEEKERLILLLNSGTHPRNVALIMKRPYKEVEDIMMQKYAPLHEAASCLNCGRSGYCNKQRQDGCDLTQWKRLTTDQVTARVVMHTRKEGFSWLKF